MTSIDVGIRVQLSLQRRVVLLLLMRQAVLRFSMAVPVLGWRGETQVQSQAVSVETQSVCGEGGKPGHLRRI